jgi:hypothetical protein
MSFRIALSLLSFVLLSFNFPAVSANDDTNFTIVEKDNRKGLFDEEGNTIIPIAYEDLGWSNTHPEVYHKVIGYRENDRWGLIDVQNEKITQALYYSLFPFCDKLIVASRGKSNSRRRVYGLLDHKGRIALSFRYTYLRSHHERLIAAVSSGINQQYGLIDKDGQAVIGFSYSKIVPLSQKTYAAYNEQEKLALVTDEGEFLTSFNYDSISDFDDNQLAVVFNNGKQGVMREDGVVVVPVEYRRVKIDESGRVNVLPFNKWIAMSGDYQKLRTYTFEEIKAVSTNLYKVKVGDISTFINTEGEFILSENARIQQLKNGFAVISKNGKLGVMQSARSKDNELILPIEYDSIRIEDKHILAARKHSTSYSWAMYDQQGRQLSSFVYQDIRSGSEGLFPVKRKNHWGYINAKGEEIISCRYLQVSDFRQGRASVTFIDGQGIIDGLGKWMIKPFKYKGASLHLERIHDDLFIFSTEAQHHATQHHGLVDSSGREIYAGHSPLTNNGSSVWETNEQGKVGLISYDGSRLLETRYDSISPLQENAVYTFIKEGRTGIMSRDGKILVDLDNNFQEVYPMHGHYLGVKLEDKFGFVDTLGRLRIANRYDSIGHFSSDMAAIKLMGRWGYINRSEVLTVQPHFDKAFPFRGELAVVGKGGRLGMVNKQGETVVPLDYHAVSHTAENRYLVEKQKNGEPQYGLVSETGRLLIYPKYDWLKDLNNGFVIIRRNERFGLLTTNGRSTIPLKYDDLRYDPYNDLYLALEEQKWQSMNVPLMKAEGQ